MAAKTRNPVPHDETFAKAMQAAANYVAAVQACIDAHGGFKKKQSARRLGPDALLRTLCLSGIISTERGAESSGWRSRRRKLRPRSQLLFFLRANVSYMLEVKEHPDRSLLVMMHGPAQTSTASPSPQAAPAKTKLSRPRKLALSVPKSGATPRARLKGLRP